MRPTQHPEPECESYPLIQRAENPSRVSIIILLAGFLITLLTASCTKPDLQEEPQPKKYPNYTLSFHGAGVDIDGLKYTRVNDLISGSTDVGDYVRFETLNFVLAIAITPAGVHPYAMGTINGRSFGLHTDSSYINLCNGAQHLPVIWAINQ